MGRRDIDMEVLQTEQTHREEYILWKKWVQEVECERALSSFSTVKASWQWEVVRGSRLK